MHIICEKYLRPLFKHLQQINHANKNINPCQVSA
jgi:hypothetical protein